MYGWDIVNRKGDGWGYAEWAQTEPTVIGWGGDLPGFQRFDLTSGGIGSFCWRCEVVMLIRRGGAFGVMLDWHGQGRWHGLSRSQGAGLTSGGI